MQISPCRSQLGTVTLLRLNDGFPLISLSSKTKSSTELEQLAITIEQCCLGSRVFLGGCYGNWWMTPRVPASLHWLTLHLSSHDKEKLYAVEDTLDRHNSYDFHCY